jgi:formyltetrahydrofolate-dependent phosphoribosylglycinamide formyltransferase
VKTDQVNARFFRTFATQKNLMFDRLQQKWKVNGLQLLLILCTFAIGGSLTGYAGRKILNLLPLDRGAIWIVLYVIVVTILWPFAVLLVSIPFGQFRFFTGYLKKMGSRMGISGKKDQKMPKNEVFGNSSPTSNINMPAHKTIAIFASGAGSNAARIIDFFRADTSIRIALIVCNKPGAGVLGIAARENIPTLIIEKEQFFRGDAYLPVLHEHNINFIILAGFLWKIPDALIHAYPGTIVNIHPALLPKYGGKGMYGQHVHAAVIAAGEKETGITIHYVDEHYDNGDIIFQATCPVLPDDTPETLAARIHQLEHTHYPQVIKNLFDVNRK